MKKSIPIIIAIVIVLGGLSAAAVQVDNTKTTSSKTITITMEIDFSKPRIADSENNYIRLSPGDEETYLMNPGQPMLPRVLKTVELPFGVRNIKVEVVPHGIEKQTVTKQIMPAPVPKPLSPIQGVVTPPEKDNAIYNSKKLFPPEWHSYRIGCGLNADSDHVTHLTINIFPVRYIPISGELHFAESADIKITYKQPRNPINFPDVYDLVIIAPEKFSSALQKLVTHKNNHNMRTILNTTEEIYSTYSGRDKPEQIKYFIEDAIDKWGVKYVLLVGGLKSLILAKPRENDNYGARGWHLPVRYSNLIFSEPGYLCDLYFADIYKYDDISGYIFDDWDSNGNGIFAEWNDETKDILDLYPDIALGRLPCRNTREVKTTVEKIITYETTTYNQEWFNSMIVISGDGFLDQIDLDIEWNTTDLPDGEYTIYAQSSNDEDEQGPVDVINITLDRTQKTNITFNHDDHLKPALQNGYPAPPIAEIVSISEGNILGEDDYTYDPTDSEAYCNDLYHWANISYVNGILCIRGKSYDPKPYGNISHIKIWIKNATGETIFTEYRNNTLTYYEGEWVTGEKLVHDRAGALYYMPEEFEKEIIWTSNGKFTEQADVIEAYNKGFGFAFFSGHGSPGWWGNHLPGLPGNRVHSQIGGLVVTQVYPRFPFFSTPVLPMRKLSNTNRFPVVVVGGCHNSMFSVSLIPSALDYFILRYLGINIYMHTYSRPIPECWSWYLIKLPKTGAIATIGNTGYGWGSEGEWCTIGVGDNWIGTEFFRQYGEENQTILGDTYRETLTSYIIHHHAFTLPEWNDFGWDIIDEKTVQQWILLGDPSLKIGGYPP